MGAVDWYFKRQSPAKSFSIASLEARPKVLGHTLGTSRMEAEPMRIWISP